MLNRETMTIDDIIDVVKSMKKSQWIQKKYYNSRDKTMCIVGFIGYHLVKKDPLVGAMQFQDFIMKKTGFDVIGKLTTYNDTNDFPEAKKKIIGFLETLRDQKNVL